MPYVNCQKHARLEWQYKFGEIKNVLRSKVGANRFTSKQQIRIIDTSRL